MNKEITQAGNSMAMQQYKVPASPAELT